MCTTILSPVRCSNLFFFLFFPSELLLLFLLVPFSFLRFFFATTLIINSWQSVYSILHSKYFDLSQLTCRKDDLQLRRGNIFLLKTDLTKLLEKADRQIDRQRKKKNVGFHHFFSYKTSAVKS